MTRTHLEVGDAPSGARPEYTPDSASRGIEDAVAVFKGRWKLTILFQLFGGAVLRFSELERAIPGVTQKVLTQQLRQLERAGVVARTVTPEVPPRVDYRLTAWGEALCPALDALLRWREADPGRPGD